MKVLIVDDDPSLSFYLREVVHAAGHDAIVATSGEQAVDRFREHHPDLVISDLIMPGMDGFMLLHELRTLKPNLIFIIITGNSSEHTAVRALEMRANNYLSKPVRYETLVSLLDKYDAIIRSRSARRTVRRMITAHSLSLRVDNRVDLLGEVADLLVEQAEDILTEDQCYGIRLGLYELLVNAMEHGNLGIGYEEKAAALEEGTESYRRLLEERRADPDRSRRRIHVDFRQTSTRLEWTIRDEGAGFSHQNLPNPLLPPFDQALSGRGVFLARFQFDDVTYHGSGNRVVATKRLDNVSATPLPTDTD